METGVRVVRAASGHTHMGHGPRDMWWLVRVTTDLTVCVSTQPYHARGHTHNYSAPLISRR